ncbi:hypothetical protein IEQ34_022365 [Dendrobium chrysotoxum]|uniref:Cytochrome b5 heme-binding domain-containing protein n=1 Tax=Dendrobium chrysotoxum TaxID=161865 RepID=A0AAV7FYU3_DENCH|nr:hypothetical protein IEQ34_022365 [Dendrobium chrysotoxum]
MRSRNTTLPRIAGLSSMERTENCLFYLFHINIFLDHTEYNVDARPCNNVADHKKSAGCTFIVWWIKGTQEEKVYDVTPFMDEHPGGDEVLLAATGKDATNDFEDVGHSDSARDMIHKYCIGEIDASTIPAKRAYVPPQQAPYNPDKTSDFVIRILQFLVPILILGLAFAVRYYTKAE